MRPDLLETMRYRFRSWIGARPLLFVIVVGWLRGNKGRICGRKTNIVIEGYPRSANTYAVACMRYWAGGRLIIASHQHSAAQFKLARTMGIPAIVLIRSPIDTILSLKIRRPRVSTDALVKEYCSFYKKTFLFKDSIVIAEFNDVIKDFRSIIDLVNKKYGTEFPSHIIDSLSAREIEKLIDNMDMEDRVQSGSRYGSRETHIARRNELRIKSPLADEYRRDIMASKFFPIAEKIYSDFVNYRSINRLA